MEGGSPRATRPAAAKPSTQQGHTLASANPAAPAVAPENVITNWEDRLDDILTSPGEETDKTRQMFEMYPRLPAEGKAEIAQHLANLVGDKDYAPLGQILTDPTQSEDVLDTLLADLLNRPNSVKLPYLLSIAQVAQHPKASEAKDMLELFLEEDYGTDWPKWQAKLDGWLKDNPD
jgi:hypothetical protein